MGRPRPKILLEWTHPRTYKSEEILQSDGIYAVFYKGCPINYRLVDKLQDLPGPRYKKTSFPNAGHALNLAEKLNEKFKTDKFEVHKLTSGTIIKNDD